MIKTLIRKYKQLSDPLKAGLWFTICTVIQRAIALLTTPIFTRLLSPDQYGVYSVYQAWFSIIQIFATLNLFYGVFNNGMTKYADDRNNFTSAMQGLSTTITILLFVLYICCRKWVNSLIGLESIYLYAMFVELLFVPAYNFWMAEQRYDYKYRTMAIITIAMAFISPCIGVISVSLSTYHKAEARVISYIFVQAVVGIYFYIYNFRKSSHFYNRGYWSFALRFNIPLIPHYLSTTLLNQVDRIMIGNMVGIGEAAIYSIAYTIATMMNIVTQAISNTFTPYIYKELKEGKIQNIRKNSNSLVVFVFFSCLLAMLFGPEIVKIFASEEYHDAIWVIPPVAASVFFVFLYSMFGAVEFYFEKTKFVMIASSGAAVLNVALNYFFIQKYGYFAAGYTTLVCYVIYAFMHWLFYNHIRQNNGAGTVFDSAIILFLSVLLVIAMIVVTVVYNSIFIRYALTLIICLLLFTNRRRIIGAIKAKGEIYEESSN